MAAAVLSPSSSGLSTPSDLQYTSKMEVQTPLIQPQNFLTARMATVLQELAYDTSSINTLITRADSNTISADNISHTTLLESDDMETIKNFLETTFLNEQSLRQRNIYLNSNEPVLLIGVPETIDLGVQQIRDLKDQVLKGLRDRGVKPVRVYVQELDDHVEDAGLSFSLLNVVNSDIGVNMVSLLDRAFYGADWKEDLVVKEGWNGYDLIWRDEVWKGTADEKEEEVVQAEPETVVEEVEEVPIETKSVIVNEAEEVEAKQEPMKTGNAGAELQRMPDAPVRSVSYKSADDVPEDTDEEEQTEPIQHPALKELLERDAQRPPVQYPTWSRSHDGEAYLDIIKTHSRGQDESEPISTISRPDDEKDDFEVVDKP